MFIIPVFPSLFSCVETENARDIYWVTSQSRHSMSHDKLVTMKLDVESEMRSLPWKTKRTERTRWMKNAKNDDCYYYYYRAYRGHSFQQHFVSLNVPHANDDNEERINIWREYDESITLSARRIHSDPLNSFVILIAYARSQVKYKHKYSMLHAPQALGMCPLHFVRNGMLCLVRFARDGPASMYLRGNYFNYSSSIF